MERPVIKAKAKEDQAKKDTQKEQDKNDLILQKLDEILEEIRQLKNK
jgi:hypothetical protein